MDKISFEDWKKVKMEVGKILEAERVPQTDKLYKLQVDIGLKKAIQIITGLVPYYSEDELIGQKIIVLVNLEPRKFAGEISEGMLLCAEKKDQDKCVLLTVEKDINSGARVT